MRVPTELPRSGDLIAGKYQVEETLGSGGMGVVFAARHLALGRRVALKLLLPAAFELPGATARFLREAQAAVAIESEHVARVLDVGTLDGGAPYIVMEHLSGSDLARVLRDRGPLAPGEAIDFVLQAGEAIAEAHALGIVHRDLKPGNLFLTRRADRSELVKVLDFGLSKMPVEAGSADAGLTATDAVAGSPHYMSPEQLRSLKEVDERTDIWALGVILYQLLTGVRPFNGSSPSAICAAVVVDQPAPMHDLRPELPPALDAEVRRCLEKDPARRTPSMAALAASLAPFALARSAQSLERIARLAQDSIAVAPPTASGGDAAAPAPPLPDAGGATRTLHRPAAPQNRAAAVLAFADTARAPATQAPDAASGAVTDGAVWAGSQLPLERTPRALIAGAVGAIAAIGALAWWSLPHGPDGGGSASSAPIAAAASTAAPAVPSIAPPPTAQSSATAQPTATAEPSARPGTNPPAPARPSPSSIAKPPSDATKTAAPPAPAVPKPASSNLLDRSD